MPQTFFKTALVLTTIFSLLVVVIPAHPYDFGPTRALFMPTVGCAMPCFLGIRPGETTLDDARALLNRHPWVAMTTVYRDTGGQVRNMTWDWNGQQPQALGSAGVIDLRDNIVTQLKLRTDVPFAEIWLAFGQPLTGNMNPPFHHANYPGFGINTASDCGGFWQAQAEVFMVEGASEGGSSTADYDMTAVRQRVCEARR